MYRAPRTVPLEAASTLMRRVVDGPARARKQFSNRVHHVHGELIVVPSAERVAAALDAGAPDAERLRETREAFVALRSISADDECVHGRLPIDRTPPCGCWPQEQAPTPVESKPTITIEEANTLMSTTEAPYGYKKDGTPRKRPAPKHVPTRKPKPKPAVSRADAEAVAPPPLTSRLVDELRAEIDRREAEIKPLRDALEALTR